MADRVEVYAHPLLAIAQAEGHVGEVEDELFRFARVVEGNDELRVKTAGEIAGYWMANPASHQGHELIAAGLLLLAGYVDGDQLLEAVRAGYERGRGSMQGYDPSG